MLVVTCYTRDAQNVQVEGNKVSFIDFFAPLSLRINFYYHIGDVVYVMSW